MTSDKPPGEGKRAKKKAQDKPVRLPPLEAELVRYEQNVNPDGSSIPYLGLFRTKEGYFHLPCFGFATGAKVVITITKQ